MVSCNFATHAICLLTLIAYKYNELQVFSATQKLNHKASYLFSHSVVTLTKNKTHGLTITIHTKTSLCMLMK